MIEIKPDLSRLIQDEIEALGAISLARFWELALYHPQSGYYEKQTHQIGAGGDFITSVSVGPMFGRLLAWQFVKWLETIPGPRQIVEAGAHDGRLALDLLTALDDHGQKDLEYWILEPSIKRRRIQKATLRNYLARVRWIDSWETIPEHSVQGVIHANELLDAFPCHRFGWNVKQRVWFEWGVGWKQGRFIWRRLLGAQTLAGLTKAYASGPLPGIESLITLAEQVAEVLPDDFTLDLSLAAESWWHEAARRLGRGRLMTLDYGCTAEEFFRPEHLTGTVRSFQRHHIVSDCLAEPGVQDLTADVNFSALKLAGEALGLLTEDYESQARFLTRILQLWQMDDGTPQDWSAKEMRQFKTLIHPDHFGRAFKVLVQRRGPSKIT